MRQSLATALAICLAPGTLLAQGTPITDAPAPRALIAQNLGDMVDDSDLGREENLKDLMQLEFDKESKSVSAAVTLSLIPGGGYGLVYAGKKAQAVVPFLLSAVGYGIGAAYMFGAFDTNTNTFCRHTRDNRVDFEECSIQSESGNGMDDLGNKAIDPRSLDGNTPYFKTGEDYAVVTTGEAFDGKERGLLIIGGTYLLTSLIGAFWAGSIVSDHNEQLQKDIESTAKNAPTIQARPVVAYDGDRGFFGLALDF